MRFAVDAYVNFARQAPWQEAVLFVADGVVRSRHIHRATIVVVAGALSVDRAGRAAMLRSRVSLAQRDVNHGLAVTLAYFKTRETAVSSAAGVEVQARHPVGNERCHGPALRSPVMTHADRPSIRPGIRLQWEAVQNAYVLLYPEGMVKLNTSAARDPAPLRRLAQRR